jgi:hypothetical protein
MKSKRGCRLRLFKKLIERNRLMGRGLGWVDVHLLAAVRLTESVRLWTRDKRLLAVATTLRLDFRDR